MRLRNAWAFILVVLTTFGCSRTVVVPVPYAPPTPLPAQPACRAAEEPNSLCIVILGDSIADGVPLTGDDRWWLRLQGALADDLPGRQVAVESWAVPASRIEVLESAAADQPALASFDIAIIVEGVNDVGNTPLDEWAKRYEHAVAAMEAEGVAVIIGAPPPNFVDGELGTRHDGVDAAIRAMAEPDRPVLDIAGRWRADDRATTYYSDNLHLNAAGQAVMADMARDVVLRLSGSGAAAG